MYRLKALKHVSGNLSNACKRDYFIIIKGKKTPETLLRFTTSAIALFVSAYYPPKTTFFFSDESPTGVRVMN